MVRMDKKKLQRTEPEFVNFKEPRNRFLGINFVSLCGHGRGRHRRGRESVWFQSISPRGKGEKGGISCGSRHVPHGLISAIKPCDVTSCGGGEGDSLWNCNHTTDRQMGSAEKEREQRNDPGIILLHLLYSWGMNERSLEVEAVIELRYRLS